MFVVDGIRYSAQDLAEKRAREAAAAAREADAVTRAVQVAQDTSPGIEELRGAVEQFAGVLADFSARLLIVQDALLAHDVLVDDGGEHYAIAERADVPEGGGEQVQGEPVPPAEPEKAPAKTAKGAKS